MTLAEAFSKHLQLAGFDNSILIGAKEQNLHFSVRHRIFKKYRLLFSVMFSEQGDKFSGLRIFLQYKQKKAWKIVLRFC